MTTTAPLEERLATGLAARGLEGFELALVLGSGLGALAEGLAEATEVPFDQVDGMPASTVPGHAGRFVLGKLGGVRTLVQQGRVHLYEGRRPEEVTASVRAFARLGARALVLTNAAGCLAPTWSLPCLMRIEDHIDLQGVGPLRRHEQGRGSPHDPDLGAVLDAAAREAGVALQSGIYAGMLGPAYETPAEIRMLGRLGARVVGMSTVAEACAAHAAGLRVAAISCITNRAAGLTSEPLDHGQVVSAGTRLAGELGALLQAAAAGLVAGAR